MHSDIIIKTRLRFWKAARFRISGLRFYGAAAFELQGTVWLQHRAGPGISEERVERL